jgi:hypothetical protein
METEKLTKTTSTEASEPASEIAGPSPAEKIRACGWWQGSVVPAAELARLDPSPTLPKEPTHWIVASQTCNLYNPSLEKIPKMEWVGAFELVEPRKQDSRMKFGKNPRVLQCYATTKDGQATWFECDIQQRHWSPRACLANAQPQLLALRDQLGGDWTSQQKDIFIRWLGRSYTRHELSDELGYAFSKSSLGTAIENSVKGLDQDVFGLFLELKAADDGDKEPETAPPAIPAIDVRPPCDVELTFVVAERIVEHRGDQPVSALSKIEEQANKEFARQYPDPRNNKAKTSAMERLRSANVRLSLAFRSKADWTVDDIERTVRFTDPDYLSGSDDAGEN